MKKETVSTTLTTEKVATTCVEQCYKQATYLLLYTATLSSNPRIAITFCSLLKPNVGSVGTLSIGLDGSTVTELIIDVNA